MIALFDMGNSRIKWAWLDQTLGQDQICLKDTGSASYRESSLNQLGALNWSGWPHPEQIIISSVASEEHSQQLQNWCVQHWQVKPTCVSAVASQCGVRNAYVVVDELGCDRWVAMLGAHYLFHTDMCIIDCGTAMTVDFLDASGQHLGGYIIPGQSVMQQSLVHATDAITSGLGQHGVGDSVEPGRSTRECIERGVIMAAVGLIEKSIKEMQSRTGKSFSALFTGGNAEALFACFNQPTLHEPNLVLVGLAQIAMNERKANLTK